MLKLLRHLMEIAARWRGSDEPFDPFVHVREPRRRAPGGRHAAVALEEPKEQSHVRALGMFRKRD